MSFFTSDCSLHESTDRMDLYQAKQVNAYFLNFGKNLSQFCSFSSGSFASSRFIINAWKQTHRKDKAAKSLAQTETVVRNRTCPGSLESEVLGRKSQWLWHAHITSKWDLLETSKKIIPTDKQTQTPSQCQNVGFKHLDVVNGMHILNTVLYNSSNCLQTLPRAHCRHSVPLHSPTGDLVISNEKVPEQLTHKKK